VPLTTKRRILNVDLWSGVHTREGAIFNEVHTPVYSRQITTSEGHRWPKGRGVRDQGGPFDTLKLEYEWPIGRSGISGKGERFGLKYTMDTGLWPSSSDLPGAFSRDGEADAYYQAWVPTSTESALKNLGTSMIASTIPTNPIVDGSVALAELYREGIPHMIGGALLKNKAGFFRDLGGEYLNYQFGWAPFVSDLKAAAKAIIDQDDIMKQLARDSGKNVHRRRVLPISVDTNIIRESKTLYPGLLPGTGFSTGVYTRYLTTEVVTRQQSFSGCYTFYVAPETWGTTERIVKEARLLYGLQLTPEVVWNLAPWSWLADWMFDVGPVLHNLSAFQNDGLVLRYGYVMEQNSRRIHRKSEGQVRKTDGTLVDFHCEDVFLGTRKIRRKATPFGFGLDTSAFTTRQWTILAALGMTRAPRTL